MSTESLEKMANHGNRAAGRAEPRKISTCKMIVPQSLKHVGMHELWKSGGPGRLLSRLRSEAQAWEMATDPSLSEEVRKYAHRKLSQSPLTNDELAELVELFGQEPLPASLNALLTMELRGERKFAPGAKGVKSTLEQVELLMLPRVYPTALAKARSERQRLKKIENNKPRREHRQKVPPAFEIAIDIIKEHFPTLKHMSAKSVANLISRLKAE